MKKCIIIPDSFKGSMTSIEICDITSKAIKERYPSCEVISIPIADGGEGTVDSFLSIFGGEKIATKTTLVNGTEGLAYWALLDKTAVIEVSSVVGITLLNPLDPIRATTFGLGNLVIDALNRGVNKIIFGLGGSATTDGGVLLAQSLGTKFYNDKNEEFIPTPLTMTKISKIDNSKTKELLKNIEIIALCDVINPLSGPTGAAHVFATQKGATTSQIIELDINLAHLGIILSRHANFDVSSFTGAGAAGGMGAGIMALLGGRLESGINILLDLVKFDSLLINTDLVITGEGKLDSQSLDGKVISGIAKRTKKASIPLLVLCGGYDISITNYKDYGISAIFSINPFPQSLPKAKLESKSNLKAIINNILDFYSVCRRI